MIEGAKENLQMKFIGKLSGLGCGIAHGFPSKNLFLISVLGLVTYLGKKDLVSQDEKFWL